MALRPWNVFTKTIYNAQADGGHISVTARISLARAQTQVQAAKETEWASFGKLLAVLLPSSAAAWLVLAATHWRYSDAERLSALEKKSGGAMLVDLLGSRIASHLGPYQIPNFMHARLYEEPLRRLRESLLLDYERTQALSRLEQITQRRVAAADIGSAGAAMYSLEPLLLDLFRTERPGTALDQVRSASHQATAVRIIFDVVCALPPEERVIPPWVLTGLVCAQGPPWTSSVQGEEMRAALLLLLLETPENCRSAASLPAVCRYLGQEGFKRKEDTYLPVKAYLLSGETPDLLRRAARLVNKQCPDSIEVSARRQRDTPSLQTKHDMRNLWTTTLITLSWAAFRAWRGEVNVKAIFAIAKSCGAALGGMAVLEGTWRAEEQLIQSEWYFKETRPMLMASFGMNLLNCFTWAFAFRYSTVIPFIACRLVKDDFLDAYRTFED